MNNPAASREVSTPRSNPQAVRLSCAPRGEELDPERLIFFSCRNNHKIMYRLIGAGSILSLAPRDAELKFI